MARRSTRRGQPAGQWSARGGFFSLGAAPTLTTPAVNARVNGYAPLMAWSAAPGATSYRFERRAGRGTECAYAVCFVVTLKTRFIGDQFVSSFL